MHNDQFDEKNVNLYIFQVDENRYVNLTEKFLKLYDYQFDEKNPVNLHIFQVDEKKLFVNLHI